MPDPTSSLFTLCSRCSLPSHPISRCTLHTHISPTQVFVLERLMRDDYLSVARVLNLLAQVCAGYEGDMRAWTCHMWGGNVNISGKSLERQTPKAREGSSSRHM